MSWDGIERRKHKRYGLQKCTLKYKPAIWWGLFHPFSDRHLVLNISAGGLNFITKEELLPEKRLILEITAPLLESGPVRALGRVVWTKKSEELAAYRTGIQFLKMSKRSRERLKLLLDNALLDQIDISTKIYLKEIEKL